MTNESLVSKVRELIQPVVLQSGYEFYHLEFVKDGGENYLRVYIDKEEGIALNDCIKVTKAISGILDEADPIPDFYYLEVSSPGIDRELHSDEHFEKYTGCTVNLRVESLVEGKKDFEGILKEFSEKDICIQCEDKSIHILRDNILSINLKGEY